MMAAMSESVTTSVRLSPKLRQALERRAKKEKRGKNWIISRALEDYLGQEKRDSMIAEARRQSLIAARQNGEDWSGDADLAQWQ
jgi:predicted transcriptional regulator